jgi:vanillate O-demethylase monooxygenase subunit
MTKTDMLACPPAMEFARNQWYVAAFSSEVGRHILRRQLLGDYVALYRTEDGTPVALADRCPHRGLPLSAGALDGDAIRCGYHGFTFAKSGQCIRVPSQATIPEKMGVRSYPLVEKSIWIWAWMGEPELADPTLIPDHKKLGLEDSNYTVTEFFRMDVPGNYQLLHENLLDVSHVTFLHPGLLDDGNVAGSKTALELADRSIRISRTMDELATPELAFAFSLEPGKRYLRTLVTETTPPGLSVIFNTHEDLANPAAPARVLISPFGITPANQSLTHQFVVTATSYEGKQPQAAIDHVWRIFEQDNVAIRAIQERYEETGQYGPEFSVKADMAALRCRLKNAELVAKDRARAA